jgi:hypothetical protein
MHYPALTHHRCELQWEAQPAGDAMAHGARCEGSCCASLVPRLLTHGCDARCSEFAAPSGNGQGAELAAWSVHGLRRRLAGSHGGRNAHGAAAGWGPHAGKRARAGGGGGGAVTPSRVQLLLAQSQQQQSQQQQSQQQRDAEEGRAGEAVVARGPGSRAPLAVAVWVRAQPRRAPRAGVGGASAARARSRPLCAAETWQLLLVRLADAQSVREVVAVLQTLDRVWSCVPLRIRAGGTRSGLGVRSRQQRVMSDGI